MKILRIALQIITVVLGLLFTLAAFSSGGFLVGLGVFAFFSVIFLFSLLLREHTESRLFPGRQLNPKVIGAFLLFPVGSLFWAAWRLSGQRLFSLDWAHQDAASLLATLGLFALSLFLLVAGIQVLRLSYRTFRMGA